MKTITVRFPEIFSVAVTSTATDTVTSVTENAVTFSVLVTSSLTLSSGGL